jgi:hypothetical protein
MIYIGKPTVLRNRKNPVINTKTIGFTIAFALVGAMLLITG